MRVLLPWKNKAALDDEPHSPHSRSASPDSTSSSSFRQTASSPPENAEETRSSVSAVPEQTLVAVTLPPPAGVAPSRPTPTLQASYSGSTPRPRKRRANQKALSPLSTTESEPFRSCSLSPRVKRRSTNHNTFAISGTDRDAKQVAASSSLLDCKPAARREDDKMTAGGIKKLYESDDDVDDGRNPETSWSSSSSPVVRYHYHLRSELHHENEPHHDYQATAYATSVAAAAAANTAAAVVATDATIERETSTASRIQSIHDDDGLVRESPPDSGFNTSSNPLSDSSCSCLFAQGLKRRGLEIVEQEGDGNCLFRAVALQVYGDAAAHAEVRKLCCDFMAHDPDHFGEFVADEDFHEYLTRKRQDGVHGNNPELQALCELFNRPLEVYTPEAGPDHPINIFQGEYKTSDVPIRLSYHDGNHYNAVINPILPTAGLGLGLPGLQPGLADKLQLAQAVTASDQLEDERELQRVVRESEQEFQLANDDALQRAIKESAFSVDHMYKDKALALSDLDATNFELEQTVLVDSMLLFQQEQGRKQRAQGKTNPEQTPPKQRGDKKGSSPPSLSTEEVAAVPPHASLVVSMASAVAASSGSSSTTSAASNQSPPVATAVPISAAASATASVPDHHDEHPLQDPMEYPETVQELVMNGFELSRVVRAYELIGDNFDDLLAFLMSQQST